MSTGKPNHFGHLLQVSKNSLQPLTLYTSFHDLINVHSRRSGADNPQGTQFWCQQKPLVASVICYKFKKKPLWSLILYTFFMILYMYIAMGQGLTTSWERNFDANRNILLLRSFVESFKKISLKSDFIHFFFFAWFYTCIQPWGRSRQPPRNKVFMSTETSCHFIHWL